MDSYAIITTSKFIHAGTDRSEIKTPLLEKGVFTLWAKLKLGFLCVRLRRLFVWLRAQLWLYRPRLVCRQLPWLLQL